MPEPLVLIPARMGSTRLPGKPLADIAGEPMIVHVWRRAREARLGPVAVATESAEVADAVRRVGGLAVMTDEGHGSGSDRIHEAAESLDPDGRHDVIVNLQGDLPTIDSRTVEAVVAPLAEPEVAIATLAAPATTAEERTSPSVVKLVGSAAGPGRVRALYFTRATAPWGDGPLLHHIGIYAYRRDALRRFVALPPSPLELREKLEQLRALEAGMRVDAAIVDRAPLGVDTAADLAVARAALARKARP